MNAVELYFPGSLKFDWLMIFILGTRLKKSEVSFSTKVGKCCSVDEDHLLYQQLPFNVIVVFSSFLLLLGQWRGRKVCVIEMGKGLEIT